MKSHGIGRCSILLSGHTQYYYCLYGWTVGFMCCHICQWWLQWTDEQLSKLKMYSWYNDLYIKCNGFDIYCVWFCQYFWISAILFLLVFEFNSHKCVLSHNNLQVSLQTYMYLHSIISFQNLLSASLVMILCNQFAADIQIFA